MDQDKRPFEIRRSVAVVGSTASGKSALASAIAKAYSGEIISVDSMQIYRGFDIGTAKPSAAERAAVPHHMIDICAPEEDFSAAEFAAMALACAEQISLRGNLPVFCGGTGLYLDCILRGGAPEETGGGCACAAGAFAQPRRDGACRIACAPCRGRPCERGCNP